MDGQQALLAIVAALVAALGYVARAYFRRVERHLRWNHRARNWVNELHLRLARVERKVFGESMPLSRERDEDENEEDEG